MTAEFNGIERRLDELTERLSRLEPLKNKFLIVGEMGILPGDFALKMASLAGFRNILVHEYLKVDWGLVYENLQRLDDLHRFRDYVVKWLRG